MIVLQIYQKIQFKRISLTLGEGWQQCKGAQGGRGMKLKKTTQIIYMFFLSNEYLVLYLRSRTNKHL